MRILLFLLLSLLLSCCCDNEFANSMEKIKQRGDTDPEGALAELDSLEKVATITSEYDKNKIQLLRVRLNDKAYVLPTSDADIKVSLKYFVAHGSDIEIQEAYYYAGSVYRDLMEFPRSIEYFLHSIEFGNNNNTDSMMLRNSFSQLHYLYMHVQDYRNALLAAEQECIISEKLGILDNISRLHKANAHFRLKNDDIAIKLMDEILDIESASEKSNRNKEVLYDLLYSYSYLKKRTKAAICYSMLSDDVSPSTTNYLALAQYHSLAGNLDSCILCYESVLTSNNLEAKYDATNQLFQSYVEKGDKTKALYYATLFNNVCSELNLGKRQELAATVNNQFKYNRDRQEEEKIKEERRFFALIASTTGILCLFIIIFSIALSYYQKYKRTKRLLGVVESLKITSELKQEKEQELFNEEKLLEVILHNIAKAKEEKESIERELAATSVCIAELNRSLEDTKAECNAKKDALKEKENELENNKQLLYNKINEITIIDLRLQHSEQELREKTELLEEKLKQNKSLFRMLHHSDLNDNANAIIKSMKKATIGQLYLNDETWKSFITAVDSIYPHFQSEVIDNLGTLKTDQLRVCYLLKAGFTNTEIQNLFNEVSRATIWRWIKKFETLLSESINSKE